MAVKFSRKDSNKYLFLALFLVISYLAFLIIKPYFVTIITSMLVAMIFYPVYTRILSKVKKQFLASFLTIFLIFLILILPSAYILEKLGTESYNFYTSVQDSFSNGLLSGECTSEFCEINSWLTQNLEKLESQKFLSSLGTYAKNFSVKYGGNIVKIVGDLVIKFFVFIFVLYYLFKDGTIFMDYLKTIIPLDKSHQQELIKKTEETLYAVLYGIFLTGIIQTIIAVIIYLLLGFKSLTFMGVLTFLGAITVGTWVVWLPAGLWMLFQGIMTSTTILIVKGVILLVLGAAFISAIDNFVKPQIIKWKSDVNVVVILIGLLGGLSLFGIIGVFVGPVILSLFLSIIKIYNLGK